MSGREHVKAMNNVGHHGDQQQLGKAVERETVRAGTRALLDRPVGSFDFCDMTVGSHNFHVNGGHVRPDALEFMVAMNVADLKSAKGVGGNDREQGGNDGGLFAVGNVHGGAVHEITGNGVEKGWPWT